MDFVPSSKNRWHSMELELFKQLMKGIRDIHERWGVTLAILSASVESCRLDTLCSRRHVASICMCGGVRSLISFCVCSRVWMGRRDSIFSLVKAFPGGDFSDTAYADPLMQACKVTCV